MVTKKAAKKTAKAAPIKARVKRAYHRKAKPATMPVEDVGFNGLTRAQAERLALLAEECSEVVHMVGKILRHGYESCHPDELFATSTPRSNRVMLEKEIADAFAAISLMAKTGDIMLDNLHEPYGEKLGRLLDYLHEQPNLDAIYDAITNAHVER